MVSAVLAFYCINTFFADVQALFVCDAVRSLNYMDLNDKNIQIAGMGLTCIETCMGFFEIVARKFQKGALNKMWSDFGAREESRLLWAWTDEKSMTHLLVVRWSSGNSELQSMTDCYKMKIQPLPRALNSDTCLLQR